MSHDDMAAWVELTDSSGQIRVTVDEAGVPRVNLGVGTKSAMEPMRFPGEVQVLVNRALGDHTAKTLARYRESLVADAGARDWQRAHDVPVRERLARLHQRTLETRRRAQEIRSSAARHEPVTAGSRNGVWVEALHGFVSAFSMDEQYFASRSLPALEDEISRVLAEAVVASASADGPLNGVRYDFQEDR